MRKGMRSYSNREVCDANIGKNGGREKSTRKMGRDGSIGNLTRHSGIIFSKPQGERLKNARGALPASSGEED
jgi:hypothetical protein